jgi:hypothetical protein
MFSNLAVIPAFSRVESCWDGILRKMKTEWSGDVQERVRRE